MTLPNDFFNPELKRRYFPTPIPKKDIGFNLICGGLFSLFIGFLVYFFGNLKLHSFSLTDIYLGNILIFSSYICFIFSFVFILSGIILLSNQPENIINHRESAKEIIDKRFAKGEISKEEYEIIKNELER